MALNALLAKMEGRAVTSVTADVTADVTPEPAPMLVCTSVTPVTAQNSNAEDVATYWHWLVHFENREPLEVYFNPDASFDKVMANYPDALAAEPLPERTRRTPTEDEAAELRALVASVGAAYSFTPGEQAEALALALNDVDAALMSYRAMAAEKGITPVVPTSCTTCKHQRRPGGVAHYCSARPDLPPAYGDGHPLRLLPDDGGVGCGEWNGRVIQDMDADPDDDRRRCGQCLNLAGRVCLVAIEIGAIRKHTPISDLPRRCEGYMPGLDEADRRTGRERWPWLIQKGGE
jgi:hypothetical protein